VIEQLGERDWDLLLTRIAKGECTPFLGAGACVGVLPLGAEIAQSWATAREYPMGDTRDLLRVSQYVALEYDAMLPRSDIVDIINGASVPDFADPNEPHGFLAKLPLPIYLTTNYDSFMMQALERQGKKPVRELCRWNREIKHYPSEFDNEAGFTPTPDRPVVFHLHGYEDKPESMVLTEDDYVDFLVSISQDNQIVPPRVQQALAGASLLFIGYSLSDWSFRVLYRGLVATKSRRYASVTVQLRPDSSPEEVEKVERQVQYLNKYFNKDNIRVAWADARVFMGELRERWERFVSTKAQVAVKPTPTPAASVPNPVETAEMARTPKVADDTGELPPPPNLHAEQTTQIPKPRPAAEESGTKTDPTEPNKPSSLIQPPSEPESGVDA
jgi:hypothetical protein